MEDRSFEITEGRGGPILLRTALDEKGMARLAREIERLGASRHPGVVEMVGHDDSSLSIAWCGGDTIETISPDVEAAAGIVAALASTVSDLHGIGLIHGRIEPSHVVIGSDGRPRLCGMRGRDPEDATALPTDDVAALGALLGRLIGTDPEVEPIPESRWRRRRWSGLPRRTLQMIVDRATDPDPAVRPTAGQLAAEIIEALPEALAPWPGVGVASSLDLDPTAQVSEPAPGGPSAGVQASSPDDAPTDAVDDDRVAATELEPPASSDHPVHGVEPVSPPVPPSDGRPATAPPIPHRRIRASTDEDESGAGAGGGTTFLGMRIEGIDGSPGSDARGEGFRPARDRRRSGGSHLPRPPVAGTDRGFRVLLPRVAAAVAVVAIGAAFLGTTGMPGTRSARGPAPAPSGPAESAPPPADPTVLPADAPDPVAPASDEPGSTPPRIGTERPTGASGRCAATPDASVSGSTGTVDLDGDGCPDPVTVDGIEVMTATDRYLVGEDGDQVSIGDWDCDGLATVGLVRPSTGEVFIFPDWRVGSGGTTVRASATLPGARRLAAPEGGSCSAEVELEDGTVQALHLMTAPETSERSEP